MILLTSYISHEQFVRTAHIGPNEEANEATEHSDKWNRQTNRWGKHTNICIKF